MKNRIWGTYLVSIMVTLCASSEIKGTNVLKLWYDKPAEYFINALPTGNGRLGAMVYGRTKDEVINLNEETLWTGGPVNLNPNPNSPLVLPDIRKALKNDDYATADKLSRKMQGYFSQSYAPVGDLLIHQDFTGEVKDYYRDLDLSNATTTTIFNANGIEYKREVIVSYPDQLILINVSSSQPGKLALKLALQSLLKPQFKKEGNTLIMVGRAPSHADPTYMSTSDTPVKWGDDCKGMRVQTHVKIINTDGNVLTTDKNISLSNASYATIAVSIGTSFNGFNKCPFSEGRDEYKEAKSRMDAVGSTVYEKLKKRHIEDYQHYFNKVQFSLNGNPQAEKLPIDERLQRYQNDKSDHGLETLLYNFGRYLMISSSRKGGIATNLQGIWNVDLQPAWSCNYTVNINLEMNYWGTDKVGLEDMSWPLVNQIKNMAETGKYTARNFYNCSGWAASHNSDIWALTNPVGHIGRGDPQWANWCMAAPWLCQHLWDKYLYSNDKEYLKQTAYPLMKGAAEFCLDWLVDDGKGKLYTAPSTSPENRYIGKDGKAWAVAKGATIDLALIRNLFDNTIHASQTLNIDKAFADKLRKTMSKLYPYKIGSQGNLQEWAEDYKDSEPTHRHVSHLIALHPGHDISAWKTPDLFNACKKTLMIRGDGGTGWSRVWKICFWSRLLDGEHAYKLLQNDLAYTAERGFSEVGGTYSNLFNACPPFQIDGNYGVVEGISEMLMQSHLGEIHLLPALPKEWADGYIKGLRARGGYTISMNWKQAKLYEATLVSDKEQNCVIRSAVRLTIKDTKVKETINNTIVGKMYLYEFKVKSGKTYYIKA